MECSSKRPRLELRPRKGDPVRAFSMAPLRGYAEFSTKPSHKPSKPAQKHTTIQQREAEQLRVKLVEMQKREEDLKTRLKVSELERQIAELATADLQQKVHAVSGEARKCDSSEEPKMDPVLDIGTLLV